MHTSEIEDSSSLLNLIANTCTPSNRAWALMKSGNGRKSVLSEWILGDRTRKIEFD